MEDELKSLREQVKALTLKLEEAEASRSHPSLELEGPRARSPSSRETPRWGKSSPPFAHGTRGLKNVEGLRKLTSDRENEEGVRQSARLPQVPLPVFEGKGFNEWCGSFSRWLRISGVDKLNDRSKMDWVVEAMHSEVKNSVAYLSDNVDSFPELISRLEQIFPETESDVSVRLKVDAYPTMKKEQETNLDRLEKYLIGFDTLLGMFSEDAITEQDAVVWLSSKLSDAFWKRCRTTAEDRRRCDGYDSLKDLIREKAKEHVLENLFETQRSSIGSKPTPNLRMDLDEEKKGKKRKEELKGINQFKASVVCHFCGKKGHYKSECWSKDPSLKPKPAPKPKAAANQGQGTSQGQGQAPPKPPPKWSPNAEASPFQPKQPEPSETPKFQPKKRKMESMHLLK